MKTETLYLKRTDKEGRATFTEHRVWDALLFMQTRCAEVLKEGGESSAEQVTRDDFLRATGRR